jgi:hypothetical protein
MNNLLMARKSAEALATMILAFALACLGPGVLGAWGQTSSTGTVSVTVPDPSGAIIPGASLELKDLATNDVRKAVTQTSGAYTFPNLPFGTYQLTVSASGFKTQVFAFVQVQTARTTEVRTTLQVGGMSETIQVTSGETPLISTVTSELTTTIDTKQVVNLPVQNRSMFPLAFLVPGWSSNSVGSTGGTWNNMPGGAIVSADFDGTPAISNRFRSGGFTYGISVVQPRIENIAEMTVNTAQLDLSGIGTSAMRISMVTRRGSNSYHGRVFEDFQNTALNANSWSNNARGLKRNIVKLNDFGFGVGGPILKNKLFFFGTYAQSIQPQSRSATASVLSAGAQQGLYSYRDSGGNILHVPNAELDGLHELAEGKSLSGFRRRVVHGAGSLLERPWRPPWNQLGLNGQRSFAAHLCLPIEGADHCAAKPSHGSLCDADGKNLERVHRWGRASPEFEDRAIRALRRVQPQ